MFNIEVKSYLQVFFYVHITINTIFMLDFTTTIWIINVSLFIIEVSFLCTFCSEIGSLVLIIVVITLYYYNT